MKMRNLAACLGLSMFSAVPALAVEPPSVSATPSTEAATTASTARSVIVHLSRSDSHAAFMATTLARTLVKEQAKVTLFLDVDGVKIADSRRTSTAMEKGASEKQPVAGRTSQADDLAAFIKDGGSVVVCTHCLKAAGIPESALIKGATIALPDQAAKLVLESNAVIDY